MRFCSNRSRFQLGLEYNIKIRVYSPQGQIYRAEIDMHFVLTCLIKYGMQIVCLSKRLRVNNLGGWFARKRLEMENICRDLCVFGRANTSIK